MVLVDGITERIGFHEGLGILPVVVIGAAEQNSDVQIDIHQIGRHQLAVDDHAGGDEHFSSPIRHVLVGVVAILRVVERSPATKQNAATADLFVARQSIVEKIEQVVVQGKNFLHELDVLHEPDNVVGKQLHGRNRTDTPRI